MALELVCLLAHSLLQLKSGALPSKSIRRRKDLGKLGALIQLIHAELPLSVALDIAQLRLPLSCPVVVSAAGQAISHFATELCIQVATLPPSHSSLPLLKSLSFACGLTFLSAEWLECAPGLQILDVMNNNLRTLPTLAAHIETVLFEGNPNLDLNNILDWRQYLLQPMLRPRRLNLILLGQASAEKTALVTALGRELTLESLGEVPVTLHCVGAEITEFLLNTRAIFLVVCSAIQVLDQPLASIQTITYWLRRVQSCALVVCTQCDAVSANDLLAVKKQLTFEHPTLYVSGHTGSGIRKLLSRIEAAARDASHFPNVSKYCANLEAELLSTPADSMGRIPADQALALGSNLYQTAGALQTLVKYGAIIHFEGTREHPESACYITQPLALAQHFQSLLAIPSIRRGLLKADDVDKDTVGLLDLFGQFDMVLRTRDPAVLLVPCLLPIQRPGLFAQLWPQHSRNELGRLVPVAAFRGFPRILLHAYNLAASELRPRHIDTAVEAVWAEGVLLRCRSTLGLLALLDSNLEIRVRFHNTSEGILLFTQLLSIVESVFESYKQAWCKLAMVAAHSDALVPFADCVQALKAGQRTLTVAGQQVSMDLLVPDVTLSHINRIPETALQYGRVLGRGAFAVVHYAEWNGRPVAVKTISVESKEAVRDFCREADLMSRVSHESLVALHGITDSAFPALVMEFIPTGDLFHDFHYPDRELDAERAGLKRLQESQAELREFLQGDRPRQQLRSALAKLVPEGELCEETRTRLQTRQTLLQDLADSMIPDLNRRLLASDRRLSLDLRLRLIHDVAAALAFLHGCEPMICHNDLRSPNVFLVQLKDPAQPVARLADYGLSRWFSGPLKMGLAAWKWLAPEVLDYRDASYFTEKADIFSLGIVLWEVLNGPGINLPYVEYEARFPRYVDLIAAIREQDLRPSLTKYCVNAFGSDRRFPDIVTLLSSCLSSSPTARPPAASIAVLLKRMLDMPVALPVSQPERKPSEVFLHSFLELGELPRPQQWACKCGQLNLASEQLCSCERPRPSGRVTSLAWFANRPWLGRNDSTLVGLPWESTNTTLTFPTEGVVQYLATTATRLWGATDARLFYLRRGSERLRAVELEGSLGAVVGLASRAHEVWLLQCPMDKETVNTTVSVFPWQGETWTVAGRVCAVASHRDMAALVFEDKAILYRDQVVITTIQFHLERFVPVTAFLSDDELLVAAPLLVLGCNLTEGTIERFPCTENVRCLCGDWVGTLRGLYRREPWQNVAGDGEISCALRDSGRLWAVDNTARLLCCYETEGSPPTSPKLTPRSVWHTLRSNWSIGAASTEPSRVAPKRAKLKRSRSAEETHT